MKTFDSLVFILSLYSPPGNAAHRRHRASCESLIRGTSAFKRSSRVRPLGGVVRRVFREGNRFPLIYNERVAAATFLEVAIKQRQTLIPLLAKATQVFVSAVRIGPLA